MSQSRNEARRSFEHTVRTVLLEQDADRFEQGIEDLRGEMVRGFRNTQRILIGLLVTVAGSAVVVAISTGVTP